jgi:hypothetical protein
LLNLTILEATFHDTSRNQKLPLDAFIEIRNITTGQVETTTTVKKSYKPKYNEHFVFRTKQNANDMIMVRLFVIVVVVVVVFGIDGGCNSVDSHDFNSPCCPPPSSPSLHHHHR